MALIKPIDNDHPGDWHHERFIEFAAAKAAINEPTPHMGVVTWMVRGQPEPEAIWRAGLYLAAYSVLTGEGIWSSWSHEQIAADPAGKAFVPWLADHWPGVHTRKPRRCVRTVRQFSQCALGFADWARDEFPRMRDARWANPEEEYDAWWKSANSIPYFGRYVSIRLLELMRRWGHMRANLYDIRAVGAHSPIRCLMLLRPDRVADLATGDARTVNAIAGEVLDELKGMGMNMSHFTYATLLCEYRSNYEGGTDYAGNQHDEELEYSLSRYADFWRERGLKSQLYEARAAIDPHECLGEIQGWTKRRLDVAGWLRTRGIVWDDTKYDYHKSIAADAPVLRVMA